jgi:hypothetical protein
MDLNFDSVGQVTTADSPLERMVREETAFHSEQIKLYAEERDNFAKCSFAESQLEADRHLVMASVVYRLMESGASYTASEKVARTDPEYLEHLAKQRQVVFDKEVAYGRAQAALSRAEMAIARVKALAGVR